MRWNSEQPDASIVTVSPHLNHYRIAVMLEPVEARIWNGGQPVWGGVIAVERFRICPPSASSQWSRLSGCDIVNLFLPVSQVDGLNAQRQTPVPLALGGTTFAADRHVLELVRRMLSAEDMAGPLQQQFCDALVTALTAYLLEHYSHPTCAQERSSLSGARLRRVLSHMSGNLGEEVSNAFLAELCGMSESHFSREFHRAVGLPPHRYMLKLRLEQARASLLACDMRVVDIAYACGFHDASHFSRSFTQHYGMPPATYRRQRCN